jgi:hypothetical protein
MTRDPIAVWERLYRREFRDRKASEDRLNAVSQLLEKNGCDCECEHHATEHDDECERCLACRIAEAVA